MSYCYNQSRFGTRFDDKRHFILLISSFLHNLLVYNYYARKARKCNTHIFFKKTLLTTNTPKKQPTIRLQDGGTYECVDGR